jgi:hypothetical protein
MSHELYKGIIDDQKAKLLMEKSWCTRMLKKQMHSSKMMPVLFQECLMNSKPQLEIFADDVKGMAHNWPTDEKQCSLKSRGLRRNCKTHVEKAFISEVLTKSTMKPCEIT